MRLPLKIHSDSVCAAVSGIEVDVTRPHPRALALRYVVTGATHDLRLPPVSAPVRTDELWRHTCFEVFVRGPCADYYEFNFAPSTQWAAYQFADYRAGMNPANAAPRIDVRSDDAQFELRAALGMDQLPSLADEAPWRLGLSAVIEETSGAKSYWALAHPPGKTDFHHADSFAYELRAPERT